MRVITKDMKNVAGVYGIRRISDGLFYYIGSSKDVWHRWIDHKGHKTAPKSSKEYQYFHDEILIKNLDDFEPVLLDELVGFIHMDDKTRLHKRLLDREIMYIRKYKELCHPIMTNEDYQHAPMKGRHHTNETKLKMSTNHADVSGKNNPFYNKTHTDEIIKLISDDHKSRIWITNGIENKFELREKYDNNYDKTIWKRGRIKRA